MDSNTLRQVAIRVSSYFKDFLETDFKKQQAPRRRIVLQSDTGFRTGMRLQSYPSLEKDVWTLLGKPSGDTLGLKLLPRKHTRSLSPVLKKVFDEQITVIAETQLDAVRSAVLLHVSETYASSIEDPETWIGAVVEQMSQQIGAHIVRPLITRLDGPLQKQAYSVIDSLYSAETEMIGAVAGDIDTHLADVLARHLARRNDEAVENALKTFFTHDGVVQALTNFFSGFVTADAYLEFRDLETFVNITEGQQLYLYIGAMRFRNVQYPLFFVPVEVGKLIDGQGYQLNLVNQLFANRAAIDFVLQELAAAKMREWTSPIEQRINYLTPEQSIYEVARGMFSLVTNAVDLAGQIELSSQARDASTADVTLSATVHLCAFERGEEALVNDYEEIIELARQGGSEVVDLFETMIKGILVENPRSISEDVESQWEGLGLSDRMVFDAPIPLNEEQRKILLAVRNPDGSIVVVEGPPGTGKSHTITAIAADCAFNQRSCLILSDKTEALDVVQDKLSEAMSRVRHDRDFPNPLLRLGRQDANFRRLVSNQTMTQVSAYTRAMRANQEDLEAERRETAQLLRNAIEKTVSTLGSIPLKKMADMHANEALLHDLMPELLEELQQHKDPALLEPLQSISEHLEPLLAYLSGLFEEADFTPESLWERVKSDAINAEFANQKGTGNLLCWKAFARLDAEQLRTLSVAVVEYRQLRMPVIGYLLRGKAVRAIEARLNALSASRPLLMNKEADALELLVVQAGELRQRLDGGMVGSRFAACYEQVVQDRLAPLSGATAAVQAITLLKRIPAVLQTMLARSKDNAKLWPLVILYLRDHIEISQAFEQAPQFDYVGTKTKLERLNTSTMNAHVDSRLVSFMENHRADARTLAALIQQRQKFPADKFEAVRSSFPVIIASIREFGEYMPLIPKLFDVVVIDEASQVSVAQALPAILRARTVVCLGDSKQFSNVKSANASIAINEKYRSNLVHFFGHNVRDDAASLQRLAQFDVKRSVLEFCSMAASYTIMLKKHFRSYPELISFSSRMFYGNQLQAIKVRSVPPQDVIKFTQVDAAGKPATRVTNIAEADFIADRLVEMLDMENPPTVGVITPFREQHTLLTKRLFGHARGQEFEDRLRLKVMTFDSCQGEERNLILYSMVATPGNDALNYIFPVTLDNASESVEDKLKVQRLNVGFSRAQDTIWFVHSQPLEQFKGAIGVALNHYKQQLERKSATVDQTDPSSPMEAKVLQWLQSTKFVQGQPGEVEIFPQFPIGDYLKQLDPTYEHPSWRVDFLLTCQTDKGPLNIVIEYDGFEFHFNQRARVHVGNHERYLKEADVERQLTLESYGYRFLRLNRFNLGKDPVATLDERLARLVEMATGEQTAKIIERLREQAAGMVNKDMKQCSRCQDIRPLAAFFDPSLRSSKGGYGRVCLPCKEAS